MNYCIEEPVNFWDHLSPEAVTRIAEIAKNGYTVPDYLGDDEFERDEI
jgi:hypothetical protein